MDFTNLQLLLAFLGSSGLIGGGFTFFKWISERLDKKKKDKDEAEQKQKAAEAEAKKVETENREKVSEALWKLYNEAKLKIDELEQEVAQLKKGDSLAQPTVTKIYRGLSKLGKEIDIADAVFIKEFLKFESNEEIKKLHDATKNQMDIIKQRFEELQNILP